MQEIDARDLAFVDEGTVGHCEKGGGVESVAIYRGALWQVLSPIPVPFGCFNASEFLCTVGKVPFFTPFRVRVVP